MASCRQYRRRMRNPAQIRLHMLDGEYNRFNCATGLRRMDGRIEVAGFGPKQVKAHFSRGSGGIADGKGQTIHKFLGKIDPTDTELVESVIQEFCNRYADSKWENMMVITKNGEVHFMTDHNAKGVDCSYLGDKLKDSYNIHTHPPDSTQFSFSTDVDMPAFFCGWNSCYGCS